MHVEILPSLVRAFDVQPPWFGVDCRFLTALSLSKVMHAAELCEQADRSTERARSFAAEKEHLEAVISKLREQAVKMAELACKHEKKMEGELREQIQVWLGYDSVTCAVVFSSHWSLTDLALC